MSFQHELFEVAEEERQQQVSDVHAVDVGVGRDHDAVVSEPLESSSSMPRARMML